MNFRLPAAFAAGALTAILFGGASGAILAQGTTDPATMPMASNAATAGCMTMAYPVCGHHMASAHASMPRSPMMGAPQDCCMGGSGGPMMAGRGMMGCGGPGMMGGGSGSMGGPGMMGGGSGSMGGPGMMGAPSSSPSAAASVPPTISHSTFPTPGPTD